MKKTIMTIMLVASTQLWAENIGTEEIQGALYLTVGADNDNACDYHNIQSAIDSGFSNTIRIASNKNYFENVEISNEDMQLIGGYADCTQAGLNITDLSQAIVTGNGADPVLGVSHTGGVSYEVKVQNIIFANGSAGVYVTTQNSVQAQTHLINVQGVNNDYGLNVFSLSNGEPTVQVEDSLFNFNEQGVYCSGAGATIRIGGDSVIANNQSLVAHGGGVAISDACEANIYSPTIVQNNEAVGHGGGIYATSGSTLNIVGAGPFCENSICMGTFDAPVLIQNNEADSDNDNYGGGGGVYVVTDSEATIFNAHVKNNQARQGGGLYASSGATVTALGYQSPGTSCWSPGACLQFESNSAVWGGAVYAGSENTNMTVIGAQFIENSGSAGAVAHVRDDSTMLLKDSVFFNNGFNGQLTHSDEELLDIFDSNMALPTTLTLDGVTIADNDITDQLVKNFNGNLEVFGSLLFDEVDVYFSSGDAPQSHFECVIAHENSSFSAGGTVSMVDRGLQPVFVNPQGGNYHLRVDSPAIDYCYDASGNSATDIDYDDRGVDNPDVDNLHGAFDLGADEFNINNDIIFKNGFEQN